MKKHFKLVARVSSSTPQAIEPVLKSLVTKGSVKREQNEFVVNADVEGDNAKELNRTFLSTLRRVEKRTRLRAEWTSDDGTTQRYFDYVLKRTTVVKPSAI